ncbi:hypothetical protein FQA47_015541 [Oryzias melastigma]|uniref:Uncharacterized protein n=1 Tax=Oryzias melastigma TaxID=30732 RepID=A0A834FQN4_ORYME|nr:hypothetical protein FQA47_015541 [Oryzias melastigma]
MFSRSSCSSRWFRSTTLDRRPRAQCACAFKSALRSSAWRSDDAMGSFYRGDLISYGSGGPRLPPRLSASSSRLRRRLARREPRQARAGEAAVTDRTGRADTFRRYFLFGTPGAGSISPV